MAKVCASSKIPIKLSTETSIMDNLRVRESCTLPQEITTWVSSVSIRKKVGGFTLGLARRAMCTRDSSKEERETARVLSGGQMVVGIRVSSETECRAVGECCTEREDIGSTKATGTTVCSTVGARSTLRTGRGTRVHSRRTSSMERVYFTRTIR